jgi:hypothetical protein
MLCEKFLLKIEPLDISLLKFPRSLLATGDAAFFRQLLI